MIFIDRKEASLYSPMTLAFLGDAVYGTLVREELVTAANCPVKKLHPASVKRVRAEYQARAADNIAEYLTEEEAAVMKRGRNAAVGGGRVPKSSNPMEYHKATGLEALFGYLHLSGDSKRARELFDIIRKTTEVMDK